MTSARASSRKAPTKKVKELPPDWAKSARAAIVARVAAEALALAALERALKHQVQQLALEFARVHATDRRRAADTAIGIVSRALDRMRAALTDATFLGRAATRHASLTRFRAEWQLVRADVDALGLEPPADLPHLALHGPEDQAQANLAGQSLAAAWGHHVIAAVYRWAAKDDGALIDAALSSEQATAPRLGRVASTETSRAFTDAREEGMGWAAVEYGDDLWFPGLFKSWDATLDKRVCRVCEDLDGKVALYGTDFEDGAEPGYVHPGCRCVVSTVFLPVFVPAEETVPAHDVDDDSPRTPDEYFNDQPDET